ncbi:MAG: di-trans,poly-cis-decaprenylcistransferase [Thermoplasmata archaeon]|nr:di-trans,poly-cis-decaprenylcistransferase [Thermoplasmata archaeon]
MEPVPNHVAIIMDGNRRFAEGRDLLPLEGYRHGASTLENVLNWSKELGIKVLTVFAFSTENMNRPSEEIDGIMDLFAENLKKIGDDGRIHKNKTRIKALGKTNELPERVQEAIHYAEEKTKEHDEFFFNIALNYGSREEIIHAVRQISKDVKTGKLGVIDIDAELVNSYLYTSGFPELELVIRTSGEKRISNFLLWQVAHSHLYFTDVYWPNFRKIDFLRAIRSYQQRITVRE